jgi:hypothetical protein
MSSPNLLAGKAYANHKSITRFSQTTKFSVQNELENKEYFPSHTPSIEKVAWRNTPDFTIIFAGVNSDGQIFPACLPHIMRVPNAPAVISVSCSDKLECIFPATISGIQFEQSVVSCVTLGQAQTHHLPFIPVDECDPATTPAIHPAGATDDPPADLGRLNWIDLNSNPNLITVFATMPKLCPIQNGFTMIWGHNIRDDALPPNNNISLVCHVWVDMMCYLFLKNNGIPFHVAESMFFQGPLIKAAITANNDIFQHITLCTSGTTAIELLGPMTTVSTEVYQCIESLHDATYSAMALPEALLPPSLPPAQSGNPGTTDIDKLINTFKHTPSRKDVEAAKEVDSNKAFYSLPAATQVTPDPTKNLPGKVIPATLHPEFVEKILEPTNAFTVTANLYQHFNAYCKKAQSSPFTFNKSISFHPSVIDGPWAIAFKTANWSIMPLAQDTTMIHSKLFLHNLLNVVQSSEKYHLHQMQNQDNNLDNHIQQPDNQHSKKASSIFVDGCQTRPESVSSLCSTTGCLIDLIAVKPKESQIYKCYQALYNILTSPTGTNWLNSFVLMYEGLHLYHNLIQVHPILQVCSLCDRPTAPACCPGKCRNWHPRSQRSHPTPPHPPKNGYPRLHLLDVARSQLWPSHTDHCLVPDPCLHFPCQPQRAGRSHWDASSTTASQAGAPPDQLGAPLQPRSRTMVGANSSSSSSPRPTRTRTKTTQPRQLGCS